MESKQTAKSTYILLGILAFLPLTARAQSYDAAWTFGNVGMFSYRLDAFEPSTLQFPELGAENPTLPLELGKRYQVKVPGYVAHPFEVLAMAPSASGDVVLLSMAIQGPFESDPAVAWQDDGKGAVRFTLTEGLYHAMIAGGLRPGYRCRPHAPLMRGEFAVSGAPIGARIPPSPVRVELQEVASGLAAPVLVVPDPIQSGRLHIVDQVGMIRVVDNGQLLPEPFLDLTSLVVPVRVNYDERGFLGLAFHPGHDDPNSPGFRRLYTYTSEPLAGPADFTVELPAGATMNHQSVVREWQWDGASAQIDPNSSRELLRIDQPQSNHNAGHMEFGPDGYLYVGLGDGGGANDTAAGHGTTGNGQNINTILGSLIRIDPLDPAMTTDSPDTAGANGAYRVPLDNPFVGVDGIDEIFAYGFRNPYRFSFDRRSGALIVPDVGQNRVEEINFVRKGHNHGWNVKEGTFKFDPATGAVGLPLDDPKLADPVVQYDHDDGLSVIGGYTYYGTAVPELWGQYICGDFSRQFSVPEGRLFVADLFAGTIQELLIGAAGDPLGLFVKGLGQDHEGEIYLVASTALGPAGDTGVVLKIVPEPNAVGVGLPTAAVLTGAGAGTQSAATGLATLRLRPDQEAVSYQLKVQGIENVTQAHIHVSTEPGGDGPPAVWLYPAHPPASLVPGEFTGVLGAGDVTAADLVGPLAGMTIADLLTAIDEDRAYVNVHTEQFPAGEIRGRLK